MPGTLGTAEPALRRSGWTGYRRSCRFSRRSAGCSRCRSETGSTLLTAALLTFHSTLESWLTRESRLVWACVLRRPSVSHLHELCSLVWKVDPLASLWPVRTPQAIISAAGKPTISPDGITRTATFRRTCHSQICSRSELSRWLPIITGLSSQYWFLS